MLLRDRFLGGVSSFALMGPDGPVGGGSADEGGASDEVTVTLDQPSGDQVADEPDDGLTPEERQQFAEMQAAELTPPAEGDAESGDGDAEKPDPGVVAKKEGAEEDSEEDDGEDKGEPAKGAKEGDAKPRRVRFSKYEREVGERDTTIKTLQEQLQQTRIDNAKFEERMAIINEALTPKQRAEKDAGGEDDPEPDPEKDIFAHNQWLRRELGRTQDAVKELRGGFQQQTQQTEVERAYATDAQQFRRQTPDFNDAYQYLLASRTVELAQYLFGKDLMAEGAQLTQQEYARIAAAVEEEEQGLVEASLQSRQSPAQRIYNLARARGYRKAEPAAGEQKQNGAAKTNGKTPGSLAATNGNGAAKPSVSEEIKRVKEGVDASMSLSDGGAAPATTITPEKLARMPQAEFDKLMDRLTEDQQRVLMGG